MRRLLVLPFIALITLATAPLTPAENAVPGAPAPAFRARSLGGASLTGPAAGKVTVLNFWATWCPPCRAETADLVRAYRALHAPDVAFLGIDTTETAPIVRTFLSAKGVPYPTALALPDAYGAFGIVGIPTTIVVDPHGVVRARWIGGITPAQLEQYVADARAGRTSTFVSADQTKIDALLAPDTYAFGDPPQRADAIKRANAAIAQAEALAARDDTRVDYERTQHEEGTLRVIAGMALRDAATTQGERIDGLTSIARGDGQLGRWQDAVDADREALALSPDAPQLIAQLSRAYYRLHDYDAMIAQAQRFTQLRPGDGDGWSDLGLAEQRARHFRDAVPAYRTSLELLRAAAKHRPTQDAIADVADTALDYADVQVSLADAREARETFALAQAYAARLHTTGRYATLKRNVAERTQEGLIAVALTNRAQAGPMLSVAPWTGADLPGSLAATLKYRLIVAARAHTRVTLRAAGLRPQWIASFCTDGLCSPHSVSFVAPESGVKTYEFQLVPPVPSARPGNVAIEVNGGTAVALPRT